jgi:hypothetical protein|nr:MAG TPA: hypothetical protein [Caudoviricetes sp.]
MRLKISRKKRVFTGLYFCNPPGNPLFPLIPVTPLSLEKGWWWITWKRIPGSVSGLVEIVSALKKE